ncbi:hypothetical protein NUM3379_03040 [Kineococcus sp. NUM-3379]
MLLPSALRRAVLATAAGLGATCVAAGLTQPAVAAPAAPAAVASPAAVATPAAVASPARTPTPEEVEQARRDAERSQAEAQAAREKVAKAQGELDALVQRASAALEAHQQAVEAKQLAEHRERLARAELADAEQRLATGKEQLGQWAADAYKDGGALQQYSGLVTVLESRSTDDVPGLLASMERLGQGRSSAVDDYRANRERATRAAAEARAAADEARLQTQKAAEAKASADALVAEQQAKLAELSSLQLTAEGTAVSQSTRAQNLRAARLAAEEALRAAKATKAVSVSGGLVGAIGECTGGDTAGYANGTIPRSALCPLWGEPTHVLRADAAHAFNQLSQAYAQHFGHPMCVTDSYRPLADQISVAARKPGLAARPGTSRHGLGIAVDLCDGVNRYGSPTYTWLKQNSAVYGWIHPSWAGPGGSGPFEPWHWEYTG